MQPRRSERYLRGSLKNEEDGDPSAAPEKEEQKKPDEPKQNGTQNKPDQPGAGVKKDGKDEAAPESDETAKKDPKAEDYQLARALDLLRGIALYKGRMVN